MSTEPKQKRKKLSKKKLHVVNQNEDNDEESGRYSNDITRALGDVDEEEDEEEKILRQFVLGGESELLEHGFGLSDHESDPEQESPKTKHRKREERAPAWHDEEDDQITLQSTTKFGKVGKSKTETFTGENLRTKFKNMVGDMSWAKLRWQKEESKLKEDEDNLSELMRSTGDYLSSSDSLARGCILTEKCTAANKHSPTLGRVNSVEFHPTAQVLLTAGVDHRLNIFQVDGKDNEKIQSVYLEQFPIETAHFNREGSEVVMGSRRKRGFYYYDMIEGKVAKVQSVLGLEEPHLSRFVTSPDGKYLVFLGHHGRMHFMSSKSKEWLFSLKMNGQVNDVTFTRDSQFMYSIGSDNEVYVWELGSRECVHRFIDDGAINGTVICGSPDHRYLVTGCESGIVNVYDRSTCHQTSTPKPLANIKNLVTKCNSAKFNATSEVLAIASSKVETALRMVHFPSMTTFSNFPDRTDKLKFPTCLDFSLNSGYLAVGDAKGTAHLYRLKHYGNY